jgi:3-oxosteroid 1-dehydrogenase
MNMAHVRGGVSPTIQEAYDVVVVGSGAAGLVAANRANDLGLSVLVIEKAGRFGGTSAVSGGCLWIPNHGLGGIADSRDKALSYLLATSRGNYRRDRIESFIDNGPGLIAYLKQIGIEFDVYPDFPDYFPEESGATSGRALFPKEFDGTELDEDFWYIREPVPALRLLNRYSIDPAQAFALSTRPPGWRWVAVKLLARYWADLQLRRRTDRDRRLTMGGALVGRLRQAMRQRNVPVLLRTALTELVQQNGRVTGVQVLRNDQPLHIMARRGVILAAGGFEHSQKLRDRHFAVPTSTTWSLTPQGGNTGNALEAGMAVGAATEFLDCCWWAPSMQLPSIENPNIDVTHQMFFDHRHPNSICVNRLGKRFVNESCSYDRFGIAMIADQRETGANVPCWMIFDAQYRSKYTAGGLMPTMAMPDRKIPPEWWDTYIYRADTISGLADRIGVDASTLCITVEAMNGYARNGVDPEFNRGGDDYDRFFGDARVGPNPCMGPIEKAPFYALRIDLGDLGTKGGLKADASARLLREDGSVIDGLYAVGNCAGSPFGDCYPGAGGTLAPAAVFAFIAANDIAVGGYTECGKG